MDKEFKDIIDKYDKIYSGKEDEDYSELEAYLDKKINSPLLGTLNCKKLLKHMDVILKYTNGTNKKIFFNKRFINQKGFVKSFINNMQYYRYKDSLATFASNIMLPSEKFFNQDFIDEFVRMNPEYYYDLYFYLTSTNKTYLLGECLRHKVDISKKISSIDDMDKQFVCNNIETFASVADYLYNLREFVKGNKKAFVTLKNYMENHPMQCINSMLITKIDKEDISKFNELLYEIVKDICVNEAVCISDIEFLFEGASSAVFKIGDKVIKISKHRFTEKLPNNPYIIKPVLRKKFELDDKHVFIEVQEMVDTTKKVTKDQLSTLYLKLRKMGLIWNDPRECNVGYLKKDNNIHWRFPIEPSDEVLNLSGNYGNEKLKEGDLVIVDNDCIYEVDNPPENITYALPYENQFVYEVIRLVNECLEHGFDPNYISDIINNNKPFTLTYGSKK